MKQEVGIWIIFVLVGIAALIAWYTNKNRKSFNDSLHRFILLFAGVFLVIFGILFIAKGLFEISILQNNFMNPDIWQWILVIQTGTFALAAQQIDKNHNKSFDASFRRFTLLVWGIFSIIFGLWFLVARMFE